MGSNGILALYAAIVPDMKTRHRLGRNWTDLIEKGLQLIKTQHVYLHLIKTTTTTFLILNKMLLLHKPKYRQDSKCELSSTPTLLLVTSLHSFQKYVASEHNKDCM